MRSIGFILAIVVGALVFYAAGVDGNVKAALLTGIATAWGILFAQSAAQKKSVDEAHREKKVEIYKKFIRNIEKMMVATKEGRNIVDAELEKDMLRMKSDIILWGGVGVVKAFNDYEAAAAKQERMFSTIEKLLRAFRVDIGLSNTTIHNFDLLGMYISEEKSTIRRLDRGETKN